MQFSKFGSTLINVQGVIVVPLRKIKVLFGYCSCVSFRENVECVTNVHIGEFSWK